MILQLRYFEAREAEGSMLQSYVLAILHMDQICGFLVSEIMRVFPL
jgi:hypothetical protein